MKRLIILALMPLLLVALLAPAEAQRRGKRDKSNQQRAQRRSAPRVQKQAPRRVQRSAPRQQVRRSAPRRQAKRQAPRRQQRASRQARPQRKQQRVTRQPRRQQRVTKQPRRQQRQQRVTRQPRRQQRVTKQPQRQQRQQRVTNRPNRGQKQQRVTRNPNRNQNQQRMTNRPNRNQKQQRVMNRPNRGQNQQRMTNRPNRGQKQQRMTNRPNRNQNQQRMTNRPNRGQKQQRMTRNPNRIRNNNGRVIRGNNNRNNVAVRGGRRGNRNNNTNVVRVNNNRNNVVVRNGRRGNGVRNVNVNRNVVINQPRRVRYAPRRRGFNRVVYNNVFNPYLYNDWNVRRSFWRNRRCAIPFLSLGFFISRPYSNFNYDRYSYDQPYFYGDEQDYRPSPIAADLTAVGGPEADVNTGDEVASVMPELNTPEERMLASVSGFLESRSNEGRFQIADSAFQNETWNLELAQAPAVYEVSEGLYSVVAGFEGTLGESPIPSNVSVEFFVAQTPDGYKVKESWINSANGIARDKLYQSPTHPSVKTWEQGQSCPFTGQPMVAIPAQDGSEHG